jgi:hypothetical protein
LFSVSSPFWAKVCARRWRKVPSCRSQFPIRQWTRWHHHQARWQELRRSEWLVILQAANARRIPTAALDSVGQAEWLPTATIHEIDPEEQTSTQCSASSRGERSRPQPISSVMPRAWNSDAKPFRGNRNFKCLGCISAKWHGAMSRLFAYCLGGDLQ